MMMMVAEIHQIILWAKWNLRVCVLLSIVLQFFLLFYARFRKLCKSNLFHLWFWSVYMLADWIATYALGQTVKIIPDDDQNENCNATDQDSRSSDQLSLFWAQFLLLHLAGPDSITSFSTGDSGLWFSTLFRFLCQVVATICSFKQLTLGKNDNQLSIATILVFLVGLIRSYERVKALVNAGFDRFGETLLPKPDPGPDYEEAVSAYLPATRSGVELVEMPINHSHDHDHDDDHIREVFDDKDINLFFAAHSFFQDFKILFSGSFLSFEKRERSRDNFLRRRHSDAFRLIEYELGFFHDLMHTKTAVLQSPQGYLRRLICISFVLAACLLFLCSDRQVYSSFDSNLTIYLLFETLCVDIVSFIKLIYSEWNVIKSPRIRPLIQATISKRRQWSRSVFQYNIFQYCLGKCWTEQFYRSVGDLVSSTRFIDKMRAMWFSFLAPVTDVVQEFIFEELKKKSSNYASDLKAAKEACSQRGISPLSPHTDLCKWSIEEFHYLESLLLWHIATELCCQNIEEGGDDDDSLSNKVKFCKLVSDYMFYLLVVQPAMLSQDMGNLSIVLQDTRAEARRFFSKHSISNSEEACQKLISVRTPHRPAVVKGTRSKSVLFDACILAKELKELKEVQWQVMVQVWIELMSYAAMNCSPATHAEQPSRGGELLTFTWLLMYHLGLGTQFSEKVTHYYN